MKKVKRKKITFSINKLFSILILVASIFMSVGYASINSIIMNISGEVVVKEQKEIFITEIKCYEEDGDNNSLCNEQNILSSYKTMVHSNITLDNNLNSTVTYQITLYNSSDVSYYFDEVLYMKGENTFNNENITFELKTNDNSSNFLPDNEVPSKSYISFNIIFKFTDNADVSNNNLESLLNFKFYRLYTVSFDANGGTVGISNKSVISDKEYGELPKPNRNDYIFDGWYTEKSGGVLINEDSIVNIENDQTLYAHWSLVKYTITYNMNDGLAVLINPSYYDRGSSFTLNNPTVSRLGYRVEWTESLYTTDWKNGFINLSSGIFEEYNSNYPNAVISEKIFLEAGVTYTLTGISAGENRWRFFDISGNYVKNSQSISFTPSVDGYVIILLHNGADESTRNNHRIVSSQGESVTIKQGSTGNRIYTANLIPTKVVIADIFERDEVTIIGNTPKKNSDGSVSFDSSKTFSNLLVKIP